MPEGLCLCNRNAVRVHAKWHAGFDLFFSRLSFRRFAKKKPATLADPRAFRFGNCSASVQGLILSQTPPKIEKGKHYPPTVAGALPEPSNRNPSHCHSLAARGTCTVPSYP
jgi:hypothetical protein